MTSQLAIPALADALGARPTVLLGDDLDPDARAALVTWAEANGLAVVERDATLAITTRPEQARGAAWVHCPFAGVEHLAGALPHDVLLTRTTGTMPQRIAEYVVAWVLAERWQVARYLADSASATWDPASSPVLPARDGAVVVGTGTMGTAIARALSTLGHRVRGLSRSGRPADAFETVHPLSGNGDTPADGGASTLDEAHTDVLVLALPHTAQTSGLITPAFLSAFAGVHLVNIGRGSAVRTRTLVDALDAGHVRHATLDVTAQEPLPPTSLLWRRRDVTITPHVAGPTLPSDAVDAVDAAYAQVRGGDRPASAVVRGRGY